MKYPKFVSKDSVIGVTALSAGVGGYLDDYLKSRKSLEDNGFKIYETASVRNVGDISNTGEIRALEFDEIIRNDEVDMVMCATGGDFLIETLPYINYENISNNMKWVMGASDPTSILYTITTKLDIATLYGLNACSYDQEKLHESLLNSIEIMKGNLIVQNSYELYERDKSGRGEGYNLTDKVYWETLNGDVDISGRIIGGCIDCLMNLLGTKYDYTTEFVERYKNDGIIWYFDVFSLTSEDLYRTLFQMKEAGWFSYVKGIVVGRVFIPNTFTSVGYKDALLKIFGDIPIIYNADIGHVAPKMTIINGSIANIKAKDGKGSIEFELS